MTDDEDSDSEEGRVLGPMLDFSRYYPTTLPMHQPQHDGSEACAMSDEVRARCHLSRIPVTCLHAGMLHSLVCLTDGNGTGMVQDVFLVLKD